MLHKVSAFFIVQIGLSSFYSFKKEDKDTSILSLATKLCTSIASSFFELVWIFIVITSRQKTAERNNFQIQFLFH
jgi:hypothetical protein